MLKVKPTNENSPVLIGSKILLYCELLLALELKLLFSSTLFSPEIRLEQVIIIRGDKWATL